MKILKILLFLVGFFLLTLLSIGAIRFFSEKQLDDVTPGIQCSEDLMKKVDAYYIIPNFNTSKISENKSWCNYILSLNKSLRLHGNIHTFNEFAEDRDEEYAKEAMEIFKKCFNQGATRFKAPQLNITKKNKAIVKGLMDYDGFFNQLFHKVYHCNDSGVPYNKFNNFF
jgi:hypothetical protein